MFEYKAFTDYDNLKEVLYEEYGIPIDAIKLTSDFCASVYTLCAGYKKYIFKLYRSFDTELALQSASIMEYLLKQSFPVVPIIVTKYEQSTITMSFTEGERTGILFDYINGVMGYDLDFESYAVEIGGIMGLLHSTMEDYTRSIIQYGKEHYISRYINLMKDLNYSPSKINELEEYGDMLWENISRTKPGFCHGDFNASNFIKTEEGKYYLFDFDCAGMAYPVNDIFTICNISNTFVRYDITEYNDPAQRYLLLKQGYEKYRKLGECDISAMYSFIGISCYWMAAQLDKYKSPLEGREWLNEEYFNNNYNWLMHWKRKQKDYS